MNGVAVSKFMVSPVLAIGIESDANEAMTMMRAQRISAVPVTGRDGRAVGVISRRDLLRAGRVLIRARVRETMSLLELPEVAAADIMSRPLVTVTPDTDVVDACKLLTGKHIHRVFVVDDGKLVGVFGTREAMAAVIEQRLATPIRELMTSPVFSIDVAGSLGDAAALLERAAVGGVIVTENDIPVGLFTEVEALEARDLPPTTPVEETMTQAMLCLLPDIPLHRAASFASATRARRIVVIDDKGHHLPVGTLTGLDFARALIA